MFRWDYRRLITCGMVILTMSASGVSAGKNDNNKNDAPTISEIGMDLEWARLRPLAERQAAAAGVADAMRLRIKSGLSSDRKSAAHFLSAEINYLIGDYRRAAEAFRKAEKEAKKGPFADDAAFANVLALEAQGRDKDAAREWSKWRERYPSSPLLSEAIVAQTWNALRRDSLRLARVTLEELAGSFPHATSNRRAVLATATIAYLEGRPEDALALLKGKDAPTVYLRALCYEANGKALKAAAEHQRLVERHPESPLRDYAMLAKANVFLSTAAYRSAAEEFAHVAEVTTRPDIRLEAKLRRAAATFLDGDGEASRELLREIVAAHPRSDVAGRAQLLLGEVLYAEEIYDEAIIEFNRVLRDYFDQNLAAGAQYRVGRCLDMLGRRDNATSAYQLVVSGYPLAPEAPAAAYLAGVGLLEQSLPHAAVPYFQLVLDRYARDDGEGTIAFASSELQELVEAALCLLQFSYYSMDNTGYLSGVPHLMLQRMPPSKSTWRAYALLIDADALAAQARYEESQVVLKQLIEEFPQHEVGISANRLLAWTYAQQGNDELAIKTEEGMLARYAAHGDVKTLGSAYLNKAHILFNQKKYKKAAATYDEFLSRFPDHEQRLLALYQAGLCHLRLQRKGDAVDRWESLVADNPSAEISERAWVRAGDVYFQTEHYEDAKRCYLGLLENFSESRAVSLGMLRLAQCDYNAGRDAEALEMFSDVIARYPNSHVAEEAGRGIERALYRLGQNDKDGKVLADLVERFPTSAFAADAQFEIAMRHYEKKSFAEAADAFRRVISQFPDYSAGDRAYFLMGDSYSQAGASREARQAYEQFMTFFPDSEFRQTIAFRLGSLRFDEGDYARAAIDFQSVLEGKAANDVAAACRFNLALCYRMLGQLEDARELLESYRKTNPGDKRAADVAYELGQIHDSEGRFLEAGEEYKRAIAANPPASLTTELHYRLGMVRENRNDDKRAIQAYRQAMAAKDKDDPFRLSAVARCAALYEKSGKWKKAIAAYRDLAKNAKDPELVVAAKDRVNQLEAIAK